MDELIETIKSKFLGLLEKIPPEHRQFEVNEEGDKPTVYPLNIDSIEDEFLAFLEEDIGFKKIMEIPEVLSVLLNNFEDEFVEWWEYQFDSEEDEDDFDDIEDNGIYMDHN